MIPTIPPTADELLAAIDRARSAEFWGKESHLRTAAAWMVILLTLLAVWVVVVAVAFTVVQALWWVTP